MSMKLPQLEEDEWRAVELVERRNRKGFAELYYQRGTRPSKFNVDIAASSQKNCTAWYCLQDRLLR